MNLPGNLRRGALAFALLFAAGAATAKDLSLLNVSYDPTRELYQEYNQLFANRWKEKTGDNLTIKAEALNVRSRRGVRAVNFGIDPFQAQTVFQLALVARI